MVSMRLACCEDGGRGGLDALRLMTKRGGRRVRKGTGLALSSSARIKRDPSKIPKLMGSSFTNPNRPSTINHQPLLPNNATLYTPFHPLRKSSLASPQPDPAQPFTHPTGINPIPPPRSFTTDTFDVSNRRTTTRRTLDQSGNPTRAKWQRQSSTSHTVMTANTTSNVLISLSRRIPRHPPTKIPRDLHEEKRQ